MKKMKKLASVLLALVMTLAMAMPVFATENEQPTVAARTYQIFQIFTGEYDKTENVLSNVKYGQNAKLPEGVAVGDAVKASVMETIAAFKNLPENERAAKIAEYANLTSEPIKTVPSISATEPVKVEGLANGYYLVRDVPGSQDGEEQNYTLYVVQVVDDILTIVPKVGTPEVEKKIVEGDEKTDNNNGAIGDTVEYEIIGTMPDNIDFYNQYFYKFTDTLSKGLSYNNDLKIYVGTATSKNEDGVQYNEEALVEINDYANIAVSEYNDVTGTEIKVAIEDVKALKNIEDANITVTKDTIIVLRYSADINASAVIGDSGNPNKVDLTYSNNPNDSGEPKNTPPDPNEPDPTVPTGKTPEKEVITYTTELKIFKHQGNNVPLPGVEFTLKSNALHEVKVVTGEEFVLASEVEGAEAEYYKLKDGTYTTTAPIREETDAEGKVTVIGNESYYEDLEPLYVKVGKSEVIKAATDEKYEVVGTVGSDGYLTFAGLKAGTYTLSETKTPAGFNTISDIEITITYNNGKFTVESSTKDANGADQTDVVEQTSNNTFSVAIENKKGSLLPSTGGIGTTIFYVVGTILVLGAGILLVTKRRMKAQ